MWGLPAAHPSNVEQQQKASGTTVDNPTLEPGELLLKPAKIAHPDGSVETVYIQSADTAEATLENKTVLQAMTKNLTTIYTLVGIIALSLTAYISYRTLKNGNK